ncbi:minor structural protein [Paucilactobacillus oligofermentans DSM 15707 = LMG 22743]|uniref:Minor structural protein n=2 Tax=Paucilactobacillus oligofermentans TaxID=293371 RepID=A0A0R1RD03_9LACO|nr:minor structural protein [Paucilactobacillus oligofermentans DSM 15707 = LMG 22743]
MQFTAYDDGSVAFGMIDSESSLFFDNQEYIIKQCVPDYNANVNTIQITATHVYNETSRIWQRTVKEGTLTYSVNDVLSFYLYSNSYGFTYEVVGSFDSQQIDSLGGDSAKDGLSKIVDTWIGSVVYANGRHIIVYSKEAWEKDLGNRIDYLNNTSEIQLTYDSTDMVNQVWVIGATIESDSDDVDSNVEQYYFEPHLVTDDESVSRWGVRPGADIDDDRFTNADSMDAYAKTQMVTDPALSFDVTLNSNVKPVPGEIRRLEVRHKNFVTKIQVVAFTWYPMDPTQNTSVTLNNTSKTILDYQNSNKRNLESEMDNLKIQINQKNITGDANSMLFTWTKEEMNEYGSS